MPTDRPNSVDVSIIVPTYNRAHWLGEALSSLAYQDVGDGLTYEIIVADNNSSDNTAAVVAEFMKTCQIPVRYVREERQGDAHARNAGIDEAVGRFIAFFDDDQFATPRWLLELVRCCEMTNADVVGGPVLLAITNTQRESLGRICREQLREIDLSDDVVEYQGKELPGTGNALVTRALIDRLHGFSLDFPSGGSDSDFFLRARESGAKLIYTPEAPIRHRVNEKRLTPDYLRWESLSSGAEHCARFDYESGGLPRLLSRCIARIGQALIIHVPLYLKARLMGDDGEALGRQTLLWRCEGYVRKTLSVLAPKACAQQQFFKWLDLSTGRLMTQA